MDEKLDKIQKSIDDLTEIVVAATHRIGEVETKADILTSDAKAGFEGVSGKIDGLHRRIDAELERTLTIEGRLVKVEGAVGLAK